MTALVAHNDVDWGGFVAVMGILVLALGAAMRDWFRSNGDYLRTWCDLALAGLDHEPCQNGDCDLVLCFCRDADAPCPGTVEPGCRHLNFLCDEHRITEHGPCCDECRADARYDAGIAW